MTFQYPTMLWWGLAAFIPLALHWFFQRKPRTAPWPAIHLVRLAQSSQAARRGQLRQRWLLAIRMLALLSFAIGLANPHCQRSPDALASKSSNSRLWIYVFDCSPSMGYADISSSRLERAVAHARSHLSTQPSGDRSSVIEWGTLAHLAAPPTHDSTAIATQFQTLQLHDGSATLDSLLSLLQHTLDHERQQAPSASLPHVIIYSDLTRRPWAEAGTGHLAPRWEKLQTHCQLTVVNVAEATPPSNTGIVACRVVSPPVIDGDRVELEMSLAHVGQTSVQQKLEIWFDNELHSRQDITLPAHGTTVVRTTRDIQTTGDKVVTLHLDPDGLACDNTYRFVLSVRPPLKVLCIGDAQRVALALAPDPQRYPRFQIHTRTATEANNVLLDSFDVVILADVEYDDALYARVAAHLQRGRGAVVFFGKRMDTLPEQWLCDSPNVQSHSARAGWLPARLDSVRSVPDGNLRLSAGPLPCWEVFRDRPHAGLLDTPIFRYRPLRPLAQVATQPLLECSNGDPLVLVGEVGIGRIALVGTAPIETTSDATSTPAVPWSLWSTWPSFPPCMHELTAYVGTRVISPRTVTVTEPLIWRESIPGEYETIQVGFQSENHVAQRTDTIPGGWVYSQPDKAGVYTFRADSQPSPCATFAVNIAAEECHIQPMDLHEFPQSIQDLIRMPPSDLAGTPAHDLLPTRKHSQRTWLIAFLILLVGETWLTRRSGN